VSVSFIETESSCADFVPLETTPLTKRSDLKNRLDKRTRVMKKLKASTMSLSMPWSMACHLQEDGEWALTDLSCS
jgi:hypothetical protein